MFPYICMITAIRSNYQFRNWTKTFSTFRSFWRVFPIFQPDGANPDVPNSRLCKSWVEIRI